MLQISICYVVLLLIDRIIYFNIERNIMAESFNIYYIFSKDKEMATCTYETIVKNYELLSDQDPYVRETANIFLLSLIDNYEIWKITEEMITKSDNPNYQLLGSQILYQKIERDVGQLTKEEVYYLKQFLFAQLAKSSFNLPIIRKIASSAGLIALICALDSWPTLITDLVKFMEGPGNQLRNGLVVFGCIAEQLKKCNRIRQGQKMQIKDKFLVNEEIISQVFKSTLTLSQDITNISLQVIQSWLKIGFPLLKYNRIISTIILLIQEQQDMFLESCCKVLSQCIQITAQEKFQTLNIIQFSVEMQKYTSTQIESLKTIIEHLRKNKTNLFAALNTSEGLQNIEIYTSIVKEMLLSFGFLLLEDIGYELVEIMINTLQSTNLKLSYSTFQFWLDFSEKLSKSKTEQVYQQKFWGIIEYVFSIVLQKTTIANESILFEMVKQQDTVDDLQQISFNQYRKQAQYIIKFVYEYFTKKKEKEGSNIFFSKLIKVIENDQQKKYLGSGTELAIYVVKSSIESMVKQYDTLNLIEFIQYVINRSELYPEVPPKIAAEIMGLIKDCNRQIKQNDVLFLKCLAFSLKYVEDQFLCHYAVYAFQSLMEIVEDITNIALINDLLAFYQSKKFKKQTVLQKVLEGILSSVTKIQNKEIAFQYLQNFITVIQNNNNNLITQKYEAQAYFLPLIEIKTLLDCFQQIKPQTKESFRLLFLNIANQGIVIIAKIIENYLIKRIKFSNVNQLGLSLSVCKNALKIYQNLPTSTLPMDSYIYLMNLILSIFNGNDISLFFSYCSLIEIINKILSQFMNIRVAAIDQWLLTNLPPINQFFMGYSQLHINNIHNFDPDIMKWYFSIQESVMIYSKEIFLQQGKTEQIMNLALISIKFLNQKQMQRKVIYFLYLCVQMKEVYCAKYEAILKTLFSSIPIINNLCYINLGKIFTTILEGLDINKKENIIRQLLEYQTYNDVQRDLKQLMAKFIAFAIQTKVERYMKGVISDLADIKLKKAGTDLALHLDMRFASWKRQYKKKVKSGQVCQ